MARIRKVNSKFSRTKAEQTLTAGVDEMFGDGSDGDVTITSGQTVYLSNDMYYENLTVQSGAVLFTNGFRIFVNDTLTNNGTIGMPSNLLQTANSSTISGRSDTTKAYRWGEGSSGSAVITVVEPSHGRTTGDTVRFRKVEAFDGFTEAVLENASGYEITVTDSNLYTFTASSGTATAGNSRGGGESATVGPVTLEK